MNDLKIEDTTLDSFIYVMDKENTYIELKIRGKLKTEKIPFWNKLIGKDVEVIVK